MASDPVLVPVPAPSCSPREFLLCNGLSLPSIGFGTWGGGVTKAQEVATAGLYRISACSQY